MTHDSKRNGVATLFAALNTFRRLGDRRLPRTQWASHQEWLWFLPHIDAMTPADKELHLIVDNASNAQARQGAALVEAASALSLSLHADELVETVESYIEKHNEKPTPFIWTAKASDILAKVKRARINLQSV